MSVKNGPYRGPRREGAHPESKDIAKSFVVDRPFRPFGTQVFCRFGLISVRGPNARQECTNRGFPS